MYICINAERQYLLYELAKLGNICETYLAGRGSDLEDIKTLHPDPNEELRRIHIRVQLVPAFAAGIGNNSGEQAIN